MSLPSQAVPTAVRVELAHHVVQVVAERAGIDVLHIKGLALDAALRYPGRSSTDVDVLVRPDQSVTLVGALVDVGFVQLGRFETSSPFEHSATLYQDHWGHVDVHRLFPGIGLPPDEAFDLLWGRRTRVTLAQQSCPVPDLTAQALILVLHAARSPHGGQPRNDLAHVWHGHESPPREAVLELARQMNAEVPVAAATGTLDRYASHPEHDLWQAVSGGGSRLMEWRARIAATPNGRARVRLLLRSAVVNVDHLAMLLGRRPTPLEVAAEFARRILRGVLELTRAMCHRWAK